MSNTISRQDQIRTAAYAVLMRYGFKRTTMDDIAKEAGISRPALYLVFKNKEEIFRDIVQMVADRCMAQAEEIAAGKSSRAKKLMDIINVAVLNVKEEVARSPHGEELLGLEGELAQDLFEAWTQRHLSLLQRVIGGRNALVHATLLIDVLNGAKKRSKDLVEIRAALKSAIDLVVR